MPEDQEAQDAGRNDICDSDSRTFSPGWRNAGPRAISGGHRDRPRTEVSYSAAADDPRHLPPNGEGTRRSPPGASHHPEGKMSETPESKLKSPPTTERDVIAVVRSRLEKGKHILKKSKRLDHNK